MAKKYGFLDVISTDVIQHEMSKRTEKALVLARLLSKGQLVPSNVVVELIAMKMLEDLDKKGFIVSGFPREKSQGKLFDKEVRPPDLVLMLNVRNSVMSDRLMARSVKETERFSTNFENIKSQIKEFHRRNKPIAKYYGKLVVVIDAEPEIMTVFEKACQVIDNVLVNFPGFETNATASTVAAT